MRDGSEEEMSAQPNTALLSTILMLGTFFIGYFLKEFRNSVFLGERTRRALGDFGVPIAILFMVSSLISFCPYNVSSHSVDSIKTGRPGCSSDGHVHDKS